MNSNKNKTEEECYIEKGDALYKENLYKKAIAEYYNALKINPKNLVTQLKIAKAKLSDNNLKGPAAAYEPEGKPPVTLKRPKIEGSVEGPVKKHPSRTTAFMRDIIYITPALIIISIAVWYFINAKESRIDSVPPKSTEEVNVRMSPEGANLIFGNKENTGPDMANVPAKPATGQKQTKGSRVDVAKKENAKKAGPKKPVTKEKLVKKERYTAGKREAKKVKELGFWATLKEYILSFFKRTGHQESGDKDIIRDPLGTEKQ